MPVVPCARRANPAYRHHQSPCQTAAATATVLAAAGPAMPPVQQVLMKVLVKAQVRVKVLVSVQWMCEHQFSERCHQPHTTTQAHRLAAK